MKLFASNILICYHEKLQQNSHSFVISYIYSPAPSGGHIFDNKSSWNSTHLLPQAKKRFLPYTFAQMRTLIKTTIFTFKMDIKIAMHTFLGHPI